MSHSQNNSHFTDKNRSRNIYYANLRNINLISWEEEARLSEIILATGCEASRKKLAKANLRFASSTAKEFMYQGLDLQDLVSEANIALYKATLTFDATRGFKFITYAVTFIRRQLIDVLAKKARIIKLPLNKLMELNKLRKAENKLRSSLGKEPTITDLAEELEFSEEKITKLILLWKKSISGDQIVNESFNTNSFFDNFSSNDENHPDKALLDESRNTYLRKCLMALSEEEQFIIEKSFGFDDSKYWDSEIIAETLGVNISTVYNKKKLALKKLKGLILNEETPLIPKFDEYLANQALEDEKTYLKNRMIKLLTEQENQ